MENKLEVQKIILGDVLQLNIKGRIDAHWSDYLNTFLDEEIRAGHINLLFNLTDVTFISSIGIRLFIKYTKQLYKINGNLSISEASPEVKKVFDLAGMIELFDVRPITEINKKINTTESFQTETASYQYSLNKESKGLKLELFGEPEKLTDSSFLPSDFRYLEFNRNKSGIGLGALGNDINDFCMRTGEFLGIGNLAAYLPSDGSNKPDFILKTGNLLPGMNVLYGLMMEGEYPSQVNFEVNTGHQLNLTGLISDLMQISGYETMAVVILAETSGLVGASLHHSPYAADKGSSPFTFPEIRNTINFTTEPSYAGTLSLVIGVATTRNQGKITQFVRPLSEFSSISGHFHAAVFPYIPLKKSNILLEESLSDLCERTQMQYLLHLINDNREINGIGDSEFKQGICWIGNIDHIIE